MTETMHAPTLGGPTLAERVPPDALEAARATLGGAVAVAERSPDGPLLLYSARLAFTDAFTVVACISAFTALAMAIVSVIILRRTAAHANASHADALANDGL